MIESSYQKNTLPCDKWIESWRGETIFLAAVRRRNFLRTAVKALFLFDLVSHMDFFVAGYDYRRGRIIFCPENQEFS